MKDKTPKKARETRKLLREKGLLGLDFTDKTPPASKEWTIENMDNEVNKIGDKIREFVLDVGIDSFRDGKSKGRREALKCQVVNCKGSADIKTTQCLKHLEETLKQERKEALSEVDKFLEWLEWCNQMAGDYSDIVKEIRGFLVQKFPELQKLKSGSDD